jgi:CheY-like chemotaxis protein
VKTILLVEDELDVMKILRLVLQGHGYFLIEAPNAETALNFRCAKSIDLLIADVTPPCSGINIACQLKASQPDLQIILTSGYPPDMWDEQQRAELSELPSDSVRVLRKPFYPADLIKIVAERIGIAAEAPTTTTSA